MLIQIATNEVEFHAIRAQGNGGQNVNKVASAVHLRFDINASSLPCVVKQRLLNAKDQRLTNEGIIVIKAQQYRSQEQNRLDALQRLHQLVSQLLQTPALRRPTKATYSSQRKRLDHKSRHATTKALRAKPID